MAASTRSLGMLTARAFWMTRRSIGLEAGSVPPDLTAMVMSFAMRANCFAMRFQRANIVCLRTSKMRPMRSMVHDRRTRCQPPAGGAWDRRREAICARPRNEGARVRVLLGQLRLQHAHAPHL